MAVSISWSMWCGEEVADADGARAPRRQDLLHRPPRLGGGLGHRPVDEVEIDVARAQRGQARVECGQGGVVALLGVPELGGDEQLLARDAARAQRRAHAPLVAVERGGVDEAVADRKPVLDLALDVRTLVGFVRAETEPVHHRHRARSRRRRRANGAVVTPPLRPSPLHLVYPHAEPVPAEPPQGLQPVSATIVTTRARGLPVAYYGARTHKGAPYVVPDRRRHSAWHTSGRSSSRARSTTSRTRRSRRTSSAAPATSSGTSPTAATCCATTATWPPTARAGPTSSPTRRPSRSCTRWASAACRRCSSRAASR